MLLLHLGTTVLRMSRADSRLETKNRNSSENLLPIILLLTMLALPSVLIRLVTLNIGRLLRACVCVCVFVRICIGR